MEEIKKDVMVLDFSRTWPLIEVNGRKGCVELTSEICDNIFSVCVLSRKRQPK